MATSTDLPPGNIVSRFLRATLAPDLSSVDLQLLLRSGPFTLRLSTESLEQITSKLSEINLHLQSRSATSTGHLAVHASEAVDVTAGAPAGGGKVILSIKGSNNVVNHFALPVAVAARFRPELRQAVQSAERQGKQTRQ
jgi:hypothetical protein